MYDVSIKHINTVAYSLISNEFQHKTPAFDSDTCSAWLRVPSACKSLENHLWADGLDTAATAFGQQFHNEPPCHHEQPLVLSMQTGSCVQVLFFKSLGKVWGAHHAHLSLILQTEAWNISSSLGEEFSICPFYLLLNRGERENARTSFHSPLHLPEKWSYLFS